MSSNTRSGLASLIFSSASWPSQASMTSYSPSLRISRINSRFTGLSSATRIFFMLVLWGDCGFPFQSSPQLGQQVISPKVVLAKESPGFAAQKLRFLLAKILGAENEDRELL